MQYKNLLLIATGIFAILGVLYYSVQYYNRVMLTERASAQGNVMAQQNLEIMTSEGN